ncbi:hypothetical protein CSOJ01_15961 [Colletotrichum sojae]|uniref:Uncharacterized protein n=1 Tax=Colletotrichum sojae TaxID=2175907 RepID=A0A8H6ILW8_9PEZI|nr:hypothetical protein CSOJ01_15961 [Colletotrichum sojae]
MKFITAIITTLLATVVSSAAVDKREGGNTNCAADQCLCEGFYPGAVGLVRLVHIGRFSTAPDINFAGAGEHEVITYICRYNPDNTDCTKLCG